MDVIETLAELTRPHDPALLEQAMLARRPLHLRTESAAAFAALMPWEWFNRLPSTRRLLTGDMRVMKDGRDVMLDMALSRAGDAAYRLTPEAIQSLCHQGMSIVLDRVHEDVAAIASLCALIERRYRCEAATNGYAGFRREGVFAPHYDDHDVLVLQLQGTKHWSLFGQPHASPVKPQFPNPADPGPARTELALAPGDLLYLPRGEVHAARVEEAPSLHLSIGLKWPRGADALRWLAGQATAEEVGREDIHPFEPAAARADRTARLRALLHGLVDRLDLDAFQAELDGARGPAHPLNLGFSSALDPKTRVQPALRRPGHASARLDGVEQAVLDLLLDRDCLTLAALDDALPGREVERAVASLARKSLIFLFPPR